MTAGTAPDDRGEGTVEGSAREDARSIGGPPPEVITEFEAWLDRYIERWKGRLLVNFGGTWQRMSEWERQPPPPATLPSREELLPTIAKRLWDEAREYVPRVLAGDPDAAPHPLRQFILAQGESDPDRFQLPEPLLGPVGDVTRVLVVGLNPGYSAEEAIPRLPDGLDAYVAWYARRFAADGRDEWGRPVARIAGVPRLVRHYQSVERDYLAGVLAGRPLGRVAVYADAIPWKWNADADPHPDLGDPSVAKYARARVQEIAAVLQPRVLVTLGVFAAGCLGLPRPAPEPAAITHAVGVWEGTCLPLFHPNKRWPASARAAYLDRVHDALRVLEA